MKDNVKELLKHFFLDIRDQEKKTFVEEYEPNVDSLQKRLENVFSGETSR